MNIECIEKESKEHPGNPQYKCVYRFGGEMRYIAIRASALKKIPEKARKT